MINTNHKQAIGAAIRAVGKWLIFTGVAAMLLPGLVFAQIPDLKVTQYQLVSSKRINATQFEYEYRVSATNTGGAAQQVVATVSSTSASTQILDGGASFGAVPAGQGTASSDTIRIRLDRRYAFNQGDLHWYFRFVAPPAKLTGAPTDLMTASTRNFYNGDGVAEAEFSDHPDYGPVARTKLTVAFLETATTQDVNAVLDTLHGGITSMLAGSAVAGLRIPDPGSVAALDALIAQTKQMPGVEDVFPAVHMQEKLLPDNPGLGGEPYALFSLNIIGHHLAAKAHGLWNAREAYTELFPSQKPTLFIVDRFGAGTPTGPKWSFVSTPQDYFSFATYTAGHGYMVSSVIGAAFGGAGDTNPDLVTGLLPAKDFWSSVELSALDLTIPMSYWDATVAMIGRMAANPGTRYVVNYSLGDCQLRSVCESSNWDKRTQGLAIAFIGAMTAAGLENRTLFALAAGQESAADAKLPAHQEGGEQRAFIGPLPIQLLRNGLVVENFMHNMAEDPANAVGCRAADSNTGGSIGAFGTHVWVYSDAFGTTANNTDSGTSLASPQVAALAEFIWSIAGTALTAPQIVDRIMASGYPQTKCGTDSGLVVDAYAAALTADSEIKIGHAPVRETILDVANDQDQDIPDGKFDHHDIRRFLKAFSDSAKAAATNGDKYIADYSRYDLNGDGYTGGSAPTLTGRLKLEEPFPASYTRPSALSYGTVTQNIEGVPVSFNENGLTDLEILAYYAYSPLFASTPESQFERAMLFLPYADKLHIELNRVLITWKPSFQPPSGWTAAPIIELYGLGPPSPTYSGGLGEKGIPPYSSAVMDVAVDPTFYDVYDTNGAPYRLYPNRLPSSSFFAYDALGRVWINATTGHWEISSTGILEREYQSRFYLGASTATGRSKTVTIGSVPGDKNFNIAKTMTGEYFDVALKFVAAP